MKCIYNKLTAHVILYCDILKPLFLRSETRLALSLPSLLFNIVLHMHLHQLICGKGGKNIQWRKDNLQKVGWEFWTATGKSMKLEHPLTSFEAMF